MKKAIISLLAVLLSLGIAYGTYAMLVMHSNGTESIRYIEPEEDYNSFADILSHPDLKGKVVYVDFWHTGCRPCLVQFESVPKLKQAFAAHNDLVFLYLGKDRSVPGEKFRWKKMIEEKQLTGLHYFMTNEVYDKIWEETVKNDSIPKAFPHYLIVDRKGNIVNDNSPRPSSDEVVPELSRALNLVDNFAKLLMIM
jgi:thiol-disulfide isomerase/thioredoxin